MTRKPSTGLERLLRLHRIDVERARGSALESERERRVAADDWTLAKAIAERVLAQRFEIAGADRFDLHRYQALLDSDFVALAHVSKRQESLKQREDDSAEAIAMLALEHRRRKATQQLHDRRLREQARVRENAIADHLGEQWLANRRKQP